MSYQELEWMRLQVQPPPVTATEPVTATGATADSAAAKEVHVDSAVKRAAAETLRMGSTSNWSLAEKMAISGRILAKQGHGDTLSGQITCRNPVDGNRSADGTMWVNPYGKPIDVVTASDFLRVD